MNTEEKEILLDLYVALYPAKYPRLWPCDCPPALMDERENAIPLFSCPYCRFTQLVDKLLSPAGDAPTERAEYARFVDGEVDYASAGDGQELENVY